MKKCTAALALAALAAAQPAAAVTFPSLTTIYVGAGVRDNDGTDTIATVFMCSNVSGVTADLRFLVLTGSGTVAGQQTITMPHGLTVTAATNAPVATFGVQVNLSTGAISQGAINIESTQSAVFCNALVMDRVDEADGVPLRLVRINGHPGAEE